MKKVKILIKLSQQKIIKDKNLKNLHIHIQKLIIMNIKICVKKLYLESKIIINQ